MEKREINKWKPSQWYLCVFFRVFLDEIEQDEIIQCK